MAEEGGNIKNALSGILAGSENYSTEKKSGGSNNPIKIDTKLSILVNHKLPKVETYGKFQRWKSKFLDIFNTYLENSGVEPAKKSADDMQTTLGKCLKQGTNLCKLIDKGDLSVQTGKKTVKAALALKEFCAMLETTRLGLEELVPATSKDERKKKYTKFHVGAALILTQFPQYIAMKELEENVKTISDSTKDDESGDDVLDKQQRELFAAYSKQVLRFCDVMADLGLFEIMKKCVQFFDKPEGEEDDDDDEITVFVKRYNDESSEQKEVDVERDETIATVISMVAEELGFDVKSTFDLKPDVENKDNDIDMLTVRHHDTMVVDKPTKSTLVDLNIEDGHVLTIEQKLIVVKIRRKNDDGSDSNETIDIVIDPNASMKELKSKISDAIPNERNDDPILFVGDTKLSDDNDSKSLADCGIAMGSVLDVDYPPPEIKVIVKRYNDEDSKSATVVVERHETIAAVVTMVADELGLGFDKDNNIDMLTVRHHENMKVDKPTKSTLEELEIDDGHVLTIEQRLIVVKIRRKDGGNETIDIVIDPKASMKELKSKISEAIPNENDGDDGPILFVNGDTKLSDDDDSQSLADCGIAMGSLLDVDYPIPEPEEDFSLVIVDTKYGTMFATDRYEAVSKGVVTAVDGDVQSFKEASMDTRMKEQLKKSMLESKNLNVKPQIVIEKMEVEDIDMEAAADVKNMWGVQLKKRNKAKSGNEIFFVDLKTKHFGLLNRKKLVDMEFITVIPMENVGDAGGVRSKDELQTLQQAEKDPQQYDYFVREIRNIFGIAYADK